MTPKLDYAFTLHVDLAPPHDFGKTAGGEKRFVPITRGILPGGGDWNAARPDGVVHVFAKYTIQAEDGTLLNVTNEGYGRASQETIKAVFGDEPSKASMAEGGAAWYTKTFPRFEVALGPLGWLNSACFVGDLLPPKVLNHVKIDVYEIL
ncbi:uncharacterized protein BDZ99DRAFT_492506 [Mytilinidion resinicola]|uniref:Uncharacterized protein n=1 Tax=Mytilinidion resinicola TaxID=574789 RepID=A0A6A6XZW9_9PEZI|nr:uncharacterized protein BDZ99DRAFT_492506 [Mytilinidion resinicola]KAF2801515.1 hypothetical protein BDZ99DRAFT_492506 [Mytilinidion resinicola]